MKKVISKTIRVVGIVITAILIPASLLALFALQGIGQGQQIIEILYIAWAIVNFVSIPFILLGFIIKYDIKIVTYFAAAHLVLSLTNMFLLLSNATTESIILLATVSLPSPLYITGLITHKKSKEKDSDEKHQSPHNTQPSQ